MTREQYDAVWTATEKAALYLRRQGAMYSTDSVASGWQSSRLIQYTVAGISEKARKHIETVYPMALIVFADSRTVAEMEQAKEAAFSRYFARMSRLANPAESR